MRRRSTQLQDGVYLSIGSFGILCIFTAFIFLTRLNNAPQRTNTAVLNEPSRIWLPNFDSSIQYGGNFKIGEDCGLELTNAVLHPYPYCASVLIFTMCVGLLLILFCFAPQLANSGQ